MEIKVAEHCGFCYGEKRAVALAQKAATDRVQGATLGPLIHNPQLIAELASNGIACKDSLEQFAPGETVIFRSHGEGPETYAQAKKQGLTILDATCPNVRLAQQKAAQAAADGYFPVIVGEKNHPEVKSILKWAGKNAICVECIKDISYVPRQERYGVIIQTTFELQKFNDILQALQEQRPGEYRVERKAGCRVGCRYRHRRTQQRQHKASFRAGATALQASISYRDCKRTEQRYAKGLQ